MTPPVPPGTLRVTWLLARTALRRRANKFGALRRKRREGRGAVGRKSGRRGALLLLALGGLMMFQAFMMSLQCVDGFLRALAERRPGVEAREAGPGAEGGPERPLEIGGPPPRFRPTEVPDWPEDPVGRRTLLVLLGGTLAVLSAAILFTTLGAAKQDLGRVAWSTEWLFTFPASARSLFLSRLGEYALTDLFSWIAVFPFLTVVFARAGRGFASPVLGAIGTLALATILAAARLAIETWLRKRFSLARLKNVQAACTVAGLATIFLTFYLALHQPVSGDLIDAASAVPTAAVWFPTAAPVLGATGPAALLGALAIAGVAAAAAIALSARLVRDGLVASTGSVARGRRGAAVPARPPRLGGILGKEVRLLVRDRNFLVQTLVLPCFVIGFQALVNPALFRGGAGITGAIVAYGVGAYVLMFGAFSVLAVERESLWLLWTFPRSLAGLLRRKAGLWATAAVLYCLAVLAFWRPGPSPELRVLVAPVMAVAGTVLSAFVATGIAALGTDPFEDRPNRRVGTQYVYLYLFLATAFGYAIWAPSLWVKFVMVVLYLLLVIALWEKAEERLPLLLDPTVSPPKQISLADGLIWAIVFFLLQLLCLVGYHAAGVRADFGLLLSFVTAGYLTVLVAISSLPRGTFPDVMRGGAPAGHRWLAPGRLALGLATGIVVGTGALGWREIVERIGFLRETRDEWLRVAGAGEPGSFLAFFLLAVVAAPLFEEFLFRGIVFRGLSRTIRPGLAIVVSALVFAIVHPPVAFPAVFALGLAAAFLYARTRSLAAAILAHAAYNLVVLLGA